jgi:hypothetical protein
MLRLSWLVIVPFIRMGRPCVYGTSYLFISFALTGHYEDLASDRILHVSRTYLNWLRHNVSGSRKAVIYLLGNIC